ncbi:BTB/POZ domain-containing protein [Rhynchospora pubera]|uniref:BTB/POZ domain-containing protein n=1 Tax=Rhynchospora pubera TaxID=906938 RepID=A0AAV8DDU3_9POAL|nr:BTB/POZ domain-containing protein [Rhynchospora pubera]
MTDCSFSVGDEIFKAHRVMMGAQSDYFRAQLYGGLAEQEMKMIPIKDVEPYVFRTLIDYVYTNFIPESTPVDLMKRLLVVADRYHIKDLRVKCEGNLVGRLSLDKAVDCHILADKHWFSTIKTMCLNLLTDPNNSKGLYLNQEYYAMVHDYPSQFAEVKEKAKSMTDGLGDTAPTPYYRS